MLCSTPSTTWRSASPGDRAAAASKSARVRACVGWAMAPAAPTAAAYAPAWSGWCSSHCCMYPSAVAWSSSLVSDTDMASRASLSPGSARNALATAEMARRSSSFSACACPSSRHASPAPSSCFAAASSASTASLSTPWCSSSRPRARAEGSPSKGLAALNSYSCGPSTRAPAAPTASCSSTKRWYVSSHSSLATPGSAPSPDSYSSAHSSAAELNSAAHVSPGAANSPSLGGSSTGTAALEANSPAQPAGPAAAAARREATPASYSDAHPPAGAGWEAANSPAQPSPGAASRTPFSSNTSSPLLILLTKPRNLLSLNLGSRLRVSASCFVLSPAARPASAAGAPFAASCCAENSSAQRSGAGACEANWSPHASGPPARHAANSPAHDPPGAAAAPAPCRAAKPSAHAGAPGCCLAKSAAHCTPGANPCCLPKSLAHSPGCGAPSEIAAGSMRSDWRRPPTCARTAASPCSANMCPARIAPRLRMRALSAGERPRSGPRAWCAAGEGGACRAPADTKPRRADSTASRCADATCGGFGAAEGPAAPNAASKSTSCARSRIAEAAAEAPAASAPRRNASTEASDAREGGGPCW
mmetsp:Transcript_3693/g.12905  ORF Transcript_3693/g.12905 Transcript_3693/m.12905 type:complete len:591 (+) Transcript_3693:414-2186(+)